MNKHLYRFKALVCFAACMSIFTTDLRASLLDDIKDLFGIEAGAKAVGQSGENMAKTIAFSVNTFATLMSFYHNGTPAEKAKAERIIRAAFPGVLDETSKLTNLEVSVEFRNLDTSQNEFVADVWFANSASTATFSDEVKSGYTFNGIALASAATNTQADLDEVRKRVANKVRDAGDPKKSALWAERLKDAVGKGIVQQKQRENISDRLEKTLRDELLVDAIMQLAIDGIDLPAANIITKKYMGKRYAIILIPKAHLEQQKKLTLNLRFYAVKSDKKGDVSKTPVREFETPFVVSMPMMRTRLVSTDDTRYNSFAYMVVDLKKEID